MAKRIACLHLPAFALQVHVRAAPHLQGTAFAIVAEGRRIMSASRAALSAGVRVGMTASRARAVAPAVRLVDAAPEAVAAAVRALAESALALSVVVDVSTAGALFVPVPPRLREAGFGERLAQVAARQGLVGRVGIADDRFTARVAAQAARLAEVKVVPRRGSAGFLAPLPLEHLPLDGDVVRMLELLGVKTIGDFAALPPPSVGRRWSAGGVDAQTLARGGDPTALVAYLPVAPVRERIELEREVAELEPLVFVLRPLLERAAARLDGRGKTAARVAVRLGGRDQTTEVVLAPSLPTTSSRTLLDLARDELAERKLEHAVDRVEVEVLEEGEPAPAELELFPARFRAAFARRPSPPLAARDVHPGSLRDAVTGR